MATVQNLILAHAPSRYTLQHICTHDEGSAVHRGLIFIRAIATFLRTLLSRKVDIVHIHVSERGSVLRTILLARIAFIFHRPVVLHAHGAEFKPFFSKMPGWAQKIISSIFGQCDGFIVLSDFWQNFYISQLGLIPERVFTLPNSVELPTEIPCRQDSSPVNLVFCGRVGHRKGAFDLIQALAELPLHLKARAHLSIAGDGEIEQGQLLADRLGVSDLITFMGWINPGQRDQMLANADIFILPSYNEGLPLAILEAMAWGIPPITTPVGGIPEVVLPNQNGLLVSPGNVQQLSKAIGYLLEDTERRLKLGKSARATAESLDIRTYTHRLGRIYDNVLQCS
ncbi:glycosyltransferase family 4 protein [Acaryochloris sp. IP29b_bin.148]|uniref:glycosyltransferase family 4 protein n=1 Tax=Acaryochloris sp. IP29b_bin.148 TaxID=2969218 RepID=UPI0026144A02|nr:glycosyltransferase family 4 protein [Acaryochloris sp. IP29b_bin.148]